MIVLAALAAYHDSFSGPFIFDDPGSITGNPTIRHLWPIWKALSPLPDQTVGGRPLLNLSLALNYALSGDAVWSYHALNLVIHILAGLTLFGIVRRTLLRLKLRRAGPAAALNHEVSFADAALPLAFTIALLWVVHPLQTESVTYVIQRAESLMGLFYLLTLYCFIRAVECRSGFTPDVSGINPDLQPKHGNSLSSLSRHSPRGEGGSNSALQSFSSSVLWWRLASIFCCLAGMATKEVMVSAPLMVLLYDRTFVAGSFHEAWQQRRKYYVGLASTWLLLGYLVVTTGSRGNSAGFGVNVAWWSYACTQFHAIVHYLQLSLWPNPLVFYYGTALVTQPAEIVPYAIIVLLLVIGTVFALWRWPAIGFLGCWFFAILAPTSSIVPIATETMAEHRMYLALAAVVVLVVAGLYRLLGRRSLILFLALAVGLGCATVQRNNVYKSALALWNDTVAKSPDNARAYYNLGMTLERLPNRTPEVIAAYEAALRLKPDYAEVHNDLGNVLRQIPDRLPDAIAEYQAALRIRPYFALAHYNLGNAYVKMGHWPEAMAEYEATLQFNPDSVGAHGNLGNILLSMPGRLPDAIAEYEAAMRIDPDSAAAHYNLGNALMKMPWQVPDAMAEFQATLRLNPDFAPAREALEHLQHPTSNIDHPTPKAE